jgi:hypothetical protein
MDVDSICQTGVLVDLVGDKGEVLVGFEGVNDGI